MNWLVRKRNKRTIEQNYDSCRTLNRIIAYLFVNKEKDKLTRASTFVSLDSGLSDESFSLTMDWLQLMDYVTSTKNAINPDTKYYSLTSIGVKLYHNGGLIHKEEKREMSEKEKHIVREITNSKFQFWFWRLTYISLFCSLIFYLYCLYIGESVRQVAERIFN